MLRQEFDDRFISLSIYRRSMHRNSVLASGEFFDGVILGARFHLDCDSYCHLDTPDKMQHRGQLDKEPSIRYAYIERNHAGGKK